MILIVFVKATSVLFSAFSPKDAEVKKQQKSMDYLWHHFLRGSPVVEPVFSCNNKLVEEIELENGLARLITVTKHFSGKTYELLGSDTLDLEIYLQIGKQSSSILQ